MEYECQLMPCDKIVIDGHGIKEPLCNDCLAPDCTNPIRDTTVYIMGVPKKMRLWAAHSMVRQVVVCKGYVSEKNVVVRTDKTNGNQQEDRTRFDETTPPSNH